MLDVTRVEAQEILLVRHIAKFAIIIPGRIWLATYLNFCSSKNRYAFLGGSKLSQVNIA